MTLTIELSDNLDAAHAALRAKARATGASEAGFVRQLLAQALTPEDEDTSAPPFETGYGMWQVWPGSFR